MHFSSYIKICPIFIVVGGVRSCINLPISIGISPTNDVRISSAFCRVHNKLTIHSTDTCSNSGSLHQKSGRILELFPGLQKLINAYEHLP